ncbi:MAG: signal recognition particle-docking protein FtsY [Chloroherpetonaceae bacterium]|nr:signal recognition particle-docking protein FtsY [bacterium]
MSMFSGLKASFKKIQSGLDKTRTNFVGNIVSLFSSNRKIDDNLLDEVKSIMLSGDIGVTATEKIIKNLRQKVKEKGYENSDQLYDLLKEEILAILNENPSNEEIFKLKGIEKPYVVMVVGVNGVGKTTTIGKLAYNFKNAGKSVVIGAADTFRAAANEQLEIWANRAGVDIIQQLPGADPAAVAFDTVKSAISKNKDVVIIDTAGRLHTKGNLMEELAKINRVIKKLKPDAPNDVYLVLDATTGQNAIVQAKEFQKISNVTGIVLTKLDGTAKGGVIIPIVDELDIPVRFIGVGEQIDDLQVFNPKEFTDALFENNY